MRVNPRFSGAGIGRPIVAATYVDRLRLYQQLDCWKEKRAIVIHAPSGYGKTSLVSRWIEVRGHVAETAWLTLDDEDGDLRRFLLRFVMALDWVLPGALALTQPILADSQVSGRRVLDRLYAGFWDELTPNALPADRHILLVLDDLHRVQSTAVDALLSSIMEMGPANLHLILLTRQRTTLPLARLYTHGGILTLDAATMRFTSEEVDDYLQHHGLAQPTPVELAQLVARTEGWVTALQLAILALPEHGGVADLFKSLHGQSDWLARYLVDEVLDRQSAETRRFLLQTSILDGFNVELCAAVTADVKAYARLDEVVENELFLIQMVDRTRWFRYHHLFRELLEDRLLVQFDVDVVAGLHARAARWLADAGDSSGAVRHFLAAGLDTAAAELVKRQMRTLLLHDPYSAQTLLVLLPHHVIAQHPQLMLDRCRLTALFDDSSTLAAVQEAEHTLQVHADGGTRQHRGELLVLTGAGHYLLRNFEAAGDTSRRARQFLDDIDDFHRGLLHFLCVHLHRRAGEWVEMEVEAAMAVTAYERAGFSQGSIALQRELAKVSMHRGDSREANRRFQELFAYLERGSVPAMRDLVLTYLSAFENSYWQNSMGQAAAYLQGAADHAIQLQDPDLMRTVACLRDLPSLANNFPDSTAKYTVDDLTGDFINLSAEAIVDLYVEGKVRCLILAGRADSAWAIIQKRRIALQPIPIKHLHRNLLTYLRAAVAEGADPQRTETALAEALCVAIQNTNRFSQLQLLVLQAWHQLLQHGAAAATRPLLEAAQLATETGYVQTILEIPQLVLLLQEMGTSFPLATFEQDSERDTAAEAIILTEQERRVLELLAAGYTYDHIGKELVISINTVRTHTRNLYRKLSVNQRSHAVRKAIRYGLLP